LYLSEIAVQEFDPEIIDKIFEKFVTKSEKGNGLGLSMSRKIVEAHGGSICARNNTNAEGATIALVYLNHLIS
jgi:nitrogen fixation/metabolism regulation signal transduction histidine kinase